MFPDESLGLPDEEGARLCPCEYCVRFLHGHRRPVVAAVLQLAVGVFHQFVLRRAAERTEVGGKTLRISTKLQQRI